MKYQELSKSEVNVFVEEKVKLLLSHIVKDENDAIFVNRETMNSDGGIFTHSIHICPVERSCKTKYWENSEIFNEKGNNLFLYLKGRLLIQTTTTWEVYSGNPFVKRYKLTCNYLVKEQK